jgi:carboxymethylenebutenolidase
MIKYMNEMANIQSTKGEINAYLARPAGTVRGGILVIHEVWGLADHIKDVADRFARKGYLALAPDLLSGTIDVEAAVSLQEDLFDPEKRNAVQPRLRELMAPLQNPSFGEDTLARVAACFDYLYELPDAQQKVAVAGFCFGGSYSFSLAVKEPRLKLALPFYGHADYSAEELANIKCPVRAFYGENDENLMKSLPELQTKMREAGVDFEAKVYPNCGHAFFNDTNKFAYNESAAKDAWRLALEHLKTYLG